MSSSPAVGSPDDLHRASAEADLRTTRIRQHPDVQFVAEDDIDAAPDEE